MRYKFRSNLNGIKILNLFVPLFNYVTIQFCAMIVARILAVLGLNKYFTEPVIDIYYKFFVVCGIVFALVYILGRKGVFIKHDHLTIARYTTTLRNWIPVIKIPYYKIESVQDNFKDLRFTKHHGSLLTPMGDNCYNVQITMKNGKKYFVSLENQEEFCDIVNAKIEQYNNAV